MRRKQTSVRDNIPPHGTQKAFNQPSAAQNRKGLRNHHNQFFHLTDEDRRAQRGKMTWSVGGDEARRLEENVIEKTVYYRDGPRK